ncbi:MAG: lysophospholipid acyltransferase family protein [Pyrinomonadaceae bacterium]
MDLLRLIAYVISKAVWFIRYRDRQNIPGKDVRSFLICANHQTYVDPVWVCLPMRRRLRFMAIENAFKWRFIGPLIRYLGAFPVSQETSGTLDAIRIALRELRHGSVLTVFPEGAREFADGKFFPFKTGAVRIAMQAGVPILPVTINGGNHIWPQTQRYPYLFRRVEIIYHPLMEIVEDPLLDKDTNLDRWTEKLKETIASSYRP